MVRVEEVRKKENIHGVVRARAAEMGVEKNKRENVGRNGRERMVVNRKDRRREKWVPTKIWD